MKKLFVAVALLGLIVSVSSCYRQGYGCKGNSRSMTGEGMKKKYSRLN